MQHGSTTKIAFKQKDKAKLLRSPCFVFTTNYKQSMPQIAMLGSCASSTKKRDGVFSSNPGHLLYHDKSLNAQDDLHSGLI
jgi:hypothetical protein